MIPLDLVLHSPRIAQNVGGIGRLCAATRTRLHIVRPIPFQLDDRTLRRAGMDYWSLADWREHMDWAACRAALPDRRWWVFSTHGDRSLWDVQFAIGDVLLFGNEPHGLPQAIHEEFGAERTVRIPMMHDEARSLNLAMAAAIGLYEALRQVRQG